LKTGLYTLIFRQRKHRVSLLTCIILAGSPMLAGIIPLPLPSVVMMIVGFGIALYVLGKYTEVPLLPEGTATIVGVEVIARIVMYALLPLFG
ncbi:MAG: hypothetical protein ACRDGA_00185, partial [Bacteroidota bacterium]